MPDWLSLIFPNSFIFGTRNNDVLAARAQGNILFGLDGHDRLSSVFNNTALLGGSGADTLTTQFTLQLPVGSPARALAIQSGDDGNDILRATVGLMGGITPSPVVGNTVDIRLDGGTGNDSIGARAFVADPSTIS
ncbi:hypothetical protein AB4144_47665, partial [Rhizobiaceae sp. 2RAB30]